MIDDVEAIVGQLQQMQNAANVHTINKAVFYLRTLFKPVWYIKDDEDRVDRFNRLVTSCRIAINTKTVVALAMVIRRWF